MFGGISGIISKRPQNSDRLMAVIKLKTPALLSTAKIINGVRTIDQDQLKQINSEQEIAITELKKLSANVCTMYRYKMVLNAVSVVAPLSVLEKLSAIGVVASWEGSGTFERPRRAVPLRLPQRGPLPPRGVDAGAVAER